jgi:hypothetical protein
MSHPINAFDDELLSAYIDGALPGSEQARIAALVQRDAEAARALTRLQYTRQILAAAPRVPVPRAFTLSEAMVSPVRRQPAGLFAWLKPAYVRGAAIAVAVCLLILLAGDIGTRAHLLPSLQPGITQVEQGGLAADQGDPTGVIAKAPTTDPDAAAPGFLGLQTQVLLMIEVGLVLLLMALMVAGWQMKRIG